MSWLNGTRVVLEKIGEIKEPVIIVTGDQVIDYEGEILEKPESKEEARKFITGYQKSPPITVSGVCVIHTGTKQKRSGVSRCVVKMRPLPDDLIEEIIDDPKSLVYSCCGGLVVDHPLVSPYVEFDGLDMSSVFGLPKDLTRELVASVLEASTE
eukprot:TRINITY_DN293_c0_g1_i3.p1 TRINITY_DN293_c0_g1~~TRINITY_DN293_c0_g1_i3.p1  ORF type:complete len:154 (+),score=28.27 TRINITY_DN293_c0_g1_i3:103-564(+)